MPLTETDVDQILSNLASLDRQELKDRLAGFKGSFKFDFTPQYLDTLSDERLRHILAAACIVANSEQQREPTIRSTLTQKPC